MNICRNEEQTLLLNSLSYFKNNFLHRSFSRISESINKVFPYTNITINTAIPSSEDVVNIVNIISNELESSRTSSDDLTVAVAKGVAKALKLFAAKCENLV